MLSDLQILEVHGEQRHKFLQGQLTCDINELALGKLAIGAQCNLKGRTYGTGFLLEHDDATLIVLPAGQATYFRDLLAKFAPFSRVTLTLRDDLLVFGLLGEAANWLALSNQLNVRLNREPRRCAQASGLSIASLDADASLWLGIIDPDSLVTALAALTADSMNPLKITTSAPWHLARLQTGIALIWPEAREQWIPQELNYDQIGAVSFKKGCYKGQEVIARIHYRGQVKQRLGLFRSNCPLAIGVNDYVIAGDTQKHIGQVIESRSFPGGQLFLAVAQRDATESTSLFLEQNDPLSGPALCPAYAITNEYFS
jgi:folate-binding protein YgfZ